MRQWLAKRAELERSHKEEKAAMEKEQKAYRRDMDKYVEAKGKGVPPRAPPVGVVQAGT